MKKNDHLELKFIRSPNEVIVKTALALLVFLRGQSDMIPDQAKFEEENMGEDSFGAYKVACLADPGKFK